MTETNAPRTVTEATMGAVASTAGLERMTPQFDILTKMIGRTRKDGTVTPNPFYRATKDEVANDISIAVEVYADVFKQFVAVWWQIGDRTTPPPREWERFAL